MWRAAKIKASVLQFSILVAVMVTMVLLSFITLNQTFSFFQFKSESLLDELRSNEDVFFSPTDENITTLSNNVDRGFRGGFQLIKVSSDIGSGEINKIGLIGTSLHSEETALYLRDDKKPLVMVGKATIQGKSYIPASGVKAGVISGTYFSGEQLINGITLLSGSKLPDLDPSFNSYLKKIQEGMTQENLDIVSNISNLKNSFQNPEKIVLSESPITVFEQAYGNIRIQSSREIIISKQADLMDVLIVSPKVKIEKGFKGRIHVIARDSIIIEENVELSYPSSLVLYSKNNDEVSNAIAIEGNSKILGNVMYIQDIKQDKPSSNLIISEDATILGSIYCQGYLDLRGTVAGSVYTEYFMTDTGGSRYINHILDGKILRNSKSELFCTLPLDKKKKGVVQWMY